LAIGPVPNTQIKYVREIEDGLRVFVTSSVDLNQDIAGIEAGFSHTVDKESESSVNCGLKFSYMRGISLNLRFQKGSNRLQFPITLSDDNGFPQVTAALLFPAAVYAFWHFYIKPFKRKKRDLKNDKILTEKGKHARNLRRWALGQQEIQRPTAVSNMRNENESDGLIILDAWYGRNVADQLSDEKHAQEFIEHYVEDPDFPSRINAKIPLQFQVKDGRLELHGSKSLLPGLYDVAERKQKHLFLRYTYRGRQKELVIGDEEALVIGFDVDQ